MRAVVLPLAVFKPHLFNFFPTTGSLRGLPAFCFQRCQVTAHHPLIHFSSTKYCTKSLPFKFISTWCFYAFLACLAKDRTIMMPTYLCAWHLVFAFNPCSLWDLFTLNNYIPSTQICAVCSLFFCLLQLTHCYIERNGND